jgi:Lon protease-like protein
MATLLDSHRYTRISSIYTCFLGAKRDISYNKMMKQSYTHVAVLACADLVFFPNCDLVLSLNDPRHIQMVKDCLTHERLMAVSLADVKNIHAHSHNTPHLICGAGQPIILEENDDSIKILLRGLVRLKLLNLIQSLPYMLYRAELIPDLESAQAHIENDLVSKLYKSLSKWAQRNMKNSIERESFLAQMTGLHQIVDAVSMFLVVDPEVRQLLLENVHLHERLQILSSLFNHEQLQEDARVVAALKNYEQMKYDESKVAH